MGEEEIREIHLRITARCHEQLHRIASEDDVPFAVLCRQALWKFIRDRASEETARKPSR